MAGIKDIYHTARRYIYLLRKLMLSMGSKTVIYTKQHPIYTSLFEELGLKEFTPVLIDLKKPHSNFLEKRLLNKAPLLHIDSANMPAKPYGKNIIVECEATPYDRYFSNAEIKKILVESKTAGKGFEHNNKVALSYPAVMPRAYTPRVVKKDKSITLLSVGHGGYIKGYDVLYKMYRQLSQQYNIKLIIAGSFGHNYTHYPEVKKESYEREDFPRIYKELAADKNVTIRPFKRKELFETIYPSADIYVQFSRMETFGYSILEAMSFGLPVISCHFKAIPEMVAHGSNGYLVNSNGYNESTNDYNIDINLPRWGENCYNESLNYFTTLLNDSEKREQFGRSSVSIVSEKFNLIHKRQFIEALYKDCINA